jgi:hypothetical protein
MRKIPFFIIIILISSCSTNSSDKNSFLLTSDLPTGEFVKESGRKLISRPYGFTKIIADSAQIDDVLIISVHGYESEGYEWVSPLINLAEDYNNTYFYRYDWDICPDSLSNNLADLIVALIHEKSQFNKIVLFGHSYGGLVVTYLASNLDLILPIEIHTIASPLAGYSRIMDKCDLKYNKDNILVYPTLETNIKHHQWRTQKHQDGAFRNLDYDPQDISFDNSKVILLPETMNGERLGHNWSITWVINNYLNN